MSNSQLLDLGLILSITIMKRSRHGRRNVKHYKCKKTMSLEFWKNKHCKKVNSKVLNPKYDEIIDPDTEKIEKFLKVKHRKLCHFLNL